MKEELMQKVVKKVLDQLENQSMSLFTTKEGMITKYSSEYRTSIDFFINIYKYSDLIKLDVKGVIIDISEHRDKVDSFLERVEIGKLKKYLSEE